MATSRYFKKASSSLSPPPVTGFESQTPAKPVVTMIESVTPLRRSTRGVKVEPVTPGEPETSQSEGKRSLTASLKKYAFDSPSKRVKVEHNADALRSPELVALEDDKPVKKKTPSKKPVIQLALDKPHPAPKNWERQYELIERMRKGIIAPVDDMGCERPRTTADADPKMIRFHILVSLMLSSQTKDPVTSQAVTNLHLALPGGLTCDSLAAASPEVVSECINKVGFWRRKTEYIQDAAKLLLKTNDGEIPNTLDGLCELRGVGPKMAFLALQCAWDINAGIGVDVHVHRITNRLRWHKPQTTNPEGTRLNLQSWLPSHLHKPINPMLVGFGQVICLPVGPRCDVCLLASEKLCPSVVRNVSAKGRKVVNVDFTTQGEAGPKLEIAYEGLQKVEDVLEVIDQVDGVVEIGDAAEVKDEVKVEGM